MIEIKTHVEVDQNALENNLSRVVKDDEVMREIQQLFADTIDPWTPFLTGKLHSDISVDSTGVTYNVPYARYQYYGVGLNHNTSFHPLATGQWDVVAMQTKMPEFEQRVKEILIRKAKEMYG